MMYHYYDPDDNDDINGGDNEDGDEDSGEDAVCVHVCGCKGGRGGLLVFTVTPTVLLERLIISPDLSPPPLLLSSSR